MTCRKSHISSLAILTATAWLGASPIALAQTTGNFGTDVSNVASISFTLGERTLDFQTNAAVFTIRPPILPAEIEFFRYAPTAQNTISRQITGSAYSPDGNLSGPFVAIDPEPFNQQDIDFSAPIPLIPATSYLPGELMFLRVKDVNRNEDSSVIETVSIIVEGDNGDAMTLELFESDPDSGEFFVHLPSTDEESQPNDGVLSGAGNVRLTTTYVDVFDNTDIVTDTAVLNPLNRVFSTADGQEVPGAVITLMNLSTGNQATVYGVDGFSDYPAQIESGLTQTDSSGLSYPATGGEFRFPMVEPGEYILDIKPPVGYRVVTSATEADATSVAEAFGYKITAASLGKSFTVLEKGPLLMDFGLDPEGLLRVTKTAAQTTGDVGDYINYTVSVRNETGRAAPARLYDTLPIGFRYEPGTSRLERLKIDDPDVAKDAALLTFDLGTIAAGENKTLDYVLRVGPGAHFGEAVNEAVVRNRQGKQVSNVARASVTLREELLRTTSTIIGRMSEKSCDGEDDWARPIKRGIGVGGVRLYMETGAYTVSDPDGLFHFEGVSEGTHVVQVDEATLPQGFELMKCEENTRYAGADNSKFIDVQGGGIWRTNFYLKQTGEKAVAVKDEEFNDSTEHLDFDAAWLDKQDATPAWAYPATERTPSNSTTHLGIKHGPGQMVQIKLNGRDLERHYYQGQTGNDARTVYISRWRGLPLQDGRNVFKATVKGADGQTVTTLREEIWYVKTIARAVALPDQSVLVADGRTPPMIAIRMEDQSGRPVHAGRITAVDLEPPYQFYDEGEDDYLRSERDSLTDPLSARQEFSIGAGGILKVPLEPTLKSGKVTIIATLDNGRKVPIYMYLQPESRDWIMVGLAEGSAALQDVSGNRASIDGDVDDVIKDGRIAFFAKGLVKGNWLMTLAVDTDKRRGNRDRAFDFGIDPNAYYTLYGDRSYQEFEGASRYPLYVKLEKRQAYAMFGDYDTNVTEGRLTSYSRRLSGLKGEYVGETLQVLGFAAETNQGFAKDEIAADGLSGPYALSQERILSQSEEVVIETRDRHRPDVILDRKTLVRYLDYTLDYYTGQLIFRLPVDATDAEFNPNVIVVEYESSEDVERNITAGGRVQATVLGERLRLGSSFVREGGSTSLVGATQSQIGVDVIAKLSDTTHIRAEIATTENKGEDSKTTGNAKLLEVVHTSEKLTADAYYREEDGGFGLGQTSSATNDIRRYGARAALIANQTDDADTGRRSTSQLELNVYREDNLTTDASRISGEVLATHKGGVMDVAGGIQVTQDEFGDGSDSRQSILAVARGSYDIERHGMNVQLSTEQPINGKDDVSDRPQKFVIGVNKTVGSKAIINLRQEIVNGGTEKSTNTVLGLSATPWSGGTATATADNLTNDSGRRLGATVGLDQNIRLSSKWSASAGLRSRKVIDSKTEFKQVAPDAAISPFEVNEDFKSAYLGAGYHSDGTAISSRVEFRDSAADTTWVGTGSAARELSKKLSLAGAARVQTVNPTDSSGRDTRFDLRLGSAWRPRDEGMVAFSRLDFEKENNANGQKTRKFVYNAALNTMVDDRWQLSAHGGLKHVKTKVDNTRLANWSYLGGAETRYDISKKIDLGLRGQILHSENAGTSYSWGPSIGVSPVKNVWVSAGYNVEGFTDRDFEKAEYSRKGAYMQMRIKFDQDTASGLLRRISPRADTVGREEDAQTLSAP